MKLMFDHLVHYVKKPVQIQKSFSELGFITLNGGRHLNWGTYNSLCYFKNGCYIEWIGIENKNVAEKADNPLIKHILSDADVGEGFLQLAFRTDNINELSTRFKGKGYQLVGPIAGSRKREDGSILTWSMLFIKQGYIQCRYPFFIQWGEEEELRQKKLKPLTRHNTGNAKIESIYFTVNHSKATAEHWKELFDIELIESFQDKKLNTVNSKISIGGIQIIFCEPIGTGQAKNALINRGENPFLCGIVGTGKESHLELFGGSYRFDT